MKSERIGGHDGMDVVRFDSGVIGKKALDSPYKEVVVEALINEATMLRLMYGSDFAPELMEVGEGYIIEEDVGISETPLDGDWWRRNLIMMLASIRSRGIRHGDLRGPNIVTRGNRPYAVDWQESHMIAEPPTVEKQPWTDSYLLMEHIADTPDVNGLADRSRIARRWGMILSSLGADKDFSLPLSNKTLIDMGCYEGDFVALAACEGMFGIGIENQQYIYKTITEKWNGFLFPDRLGWIVDDIANRTDNGADVVLLLSTWPYIVQQWGRISAEATLQGIIQNNGILFFESQLAGDGPGPKFLQSDEDVGNLLAQYGTPSILGTLEVEGRAAHRTVFRVDRK